MVLGIVSLVVSAASALFAGLVAKLDRARWRAEATAMGSATINLDLQQSFGQWILRISNAGPAVAEELTVAPSARDDLPVQLDLLRGIFPIRLAQGQRFDLPILPGISHPRHFVLFIEVQWTDGNGPHRSEIPVAATAAGDPTID